MGEGAIAVGVDILEIPRLKQTLERWGGRFQSRVYTPAELEYCRGRAGELAVRFCAKEAVMKVLGTGLRVSWREIEIVHDTLGKPEVRLSGQAQKIARERGVREIAVSLSHSGEHAIALAIATRSQILH